MKKVLIAVILMLFVPLLAGCIEEDNKPPVPSLKASATFINVDERVTFSGNDSVDRDGKIVRYFWDFGDGTNATGKYITHNYENGGNYTVILIITDDDNKKAIETITIHVNEIPIIPTIGISLPAYIHEPVDFNANESYDPDGFITAYFWNLGDGTNATGKTVSHIYTTKDTFTVTLTVTDNAHAKTAKWADFEVRYRTYNVSWDIDQVEAYDTGGFNLEGYSELRFTNITVNNITTMTFNMTWDDDKKYLLVEPNDEFIINITSPDEVMYEGGPSVSEQILLYAPSSSTMNDLPWEGIDQIEAESVPILELSLAEEYTTSEGTGDWAFNITLTEAGGRVENPLPGSQDFDYGNEWQLEVICFYYKPVITR